MAVTVIDSSNMEGFVADATNTPIPEPESVAEPVSEPVEDLDAEGDDGLTAREKQELTEKMRKAVGKRVRAQREAEEYAAEQLKLRREAENRAQELEQRLKSIPQSDPVAETNERPSRQNYATDDEYIQAAISYDVAQALAKRDAEVKAAAEAQRQGEVLAQAKARISAAIELVPDFEDVISASDINIPPHIAGYMQESEMFAELGYFLANNPSVVDSIAKMSPTRQLVEIGKIESKLVPFAPEKASNTNATPASSNGKPAKAPSDPTAEMQSPARKSAPVITPVTVNGTGSSEPTLESVRDHIADFQRRKGANLARRQRH